MTTSTLIGGCACGAVRYECQAAPVFSGHCHCRDCQRAAGAPYATVFGVPKAAFHQLSGTTSHWSTKGDSGQAVTRHFCPTCGSPLYTEVAVMPDLMMVKTMSLDDPSAVAPAMHVYCASAAAWDQPDDRLPRIAGMPG